MPEGMVDVVSATSVFAVFPTIIGAGAWVDVGDDDGGDAVDPLVFDFTPRVVPR